MTIPTNAYFWAETIDPSDRLDFKVDLAGLLQADEAIDSYTLIAYAESLLFGLNVETAPYTSTIVDNVLVLWPYIEDAEANNSAFTAGVDLPIELTVVTDSVPARKFQRTLVVRAVQR